MRAAMERREAPGLLARARAPRDPHCPQSLGSRKLGVWPGFARPVEEVSQTSWAPPGAPSLSFGRRSIPLLWEREGKQGDGRSRASEKQNPGTAERWLNGGVG